MLGLKLIHVSKNDPSCKMTWKTLQMLNILQYNYENTHFRYFVG